MKELKDYIITIPDFPQKGIMFRDVTGILQDADGFDLAIDALIERASSYSFDVIAGIESRGFVLAAPLALHFHKPLALVRKKGKLPRKTVSITYDLEYGQEEIEMHTDAIKPGQRVLLIDDLIATGGTSEAAIQLIRQLGGKIEAVLFLIELKGLRGRDRLDYPVESIVQYEGK